MPDRSFLASAKAWTLAQKSQRPLVFWGVLPLMALLLAGFILFVGLFLAVWLGVFGELPSRSELSHIQNADASYLLDRNGKVLSRYYKQNREIAELDELPPVLIEALVATEDERFFQHKGVDWIATGRAMVYSVMLGKREQGGGSTLSQQLAKQHFPRRKGKLGALIGKFKEGIIANRFEKEFSKEDLLALYLNTVDFGENIYGVKVAARRFFDVDVSDLKTEQAAVLVGMLKATNSYNPVLHPKRSKERRNLVLSRMEGQGFISAAQKDSLQALSLKLDAGRDRVLAQTSYLSERAKTDIEVALEDLTDAEGKPYDLYTSGLRIYTTIDASTQALAEKALQETLAELQPKFFEHWKTKSPDAFDPMLKEAVTGSSRYRALIDSGKSGAEAMASFGESREITFNSLAAAGPGVRKSTWSDSVRMELLRLRAGFIVADAQKQGLLAYVGGADFQAVPFNSALAKRQVGSTLKPLTYAAAIERGAAPCEYFANELRTYTDYEDWTPKNSDDTYGGEYSMIGGLVGSVNTVAVQLAFRAGPKNIQKLAEKIGLEGVPAEPSVALGTPSLSIEDMVKLYGTFARHGTVPTYQLVTRIETRTGDLLYESEPKPSTEYVISKRTAEIMDYALRQVALRGTGAGLYSRFGIQSEIAGKTGTTQNQADGWFMGFTDDVVVGAWVGGAYPNIRWRSLSLGQGARTALPIVGRFLRAYEKKNGVSQLSALPEDILFDVECEDHVDYSGYDPFGDEEDTVDFAELFEEVFRKRREKAERTEQQENPREDAAREREARLRAERERVLDQAREQREKDRKKAERRERRREVIEKIFGNPD